MLRALGRYKVNINCPYFLSKFYMFYDFILKSFHYKSDERSKMVYIVYIGKNVHIYMHVHMFNVACPLNRNTT